MKYHDILKLSFYIVVEMVFLYSFYLSWKYATIKKEGVYAIDIAINSVNLIASLGFTFYFFASKSYSKCLIKILSLIIVILFNIDIYFIYKTQHNIPIYFDGIFHIFQKLKSLI